MRISKPILPLFKQFINDSESGKRLKKDGAKISKGTIDNYRYVYHNLVAFCADTNFDLRICEAHKLNQREFVAEKNYWKKFHRRFSAYLYKKGCYDNYVGANFKNFRTFINYLRNEKNFNTGDFYKSLHIRKEEVAILVLSPEQLKFLIHDRDFEASLTSAERRIKDVFVMGCTTGLRFSDLFLLTTKNIETTADGVYLKTRSKKTKSNSAIKLPGYALDIVDRYKSRSSKKPLFAPVSLFIFNRTLKQIGEKAGFVQPIQVTREKLGKTTVVAKNNKVERFCDKMSSHMMRRTAITTLLILGMPEHMVRAISGHSANSTSFYRYVKYAQSYLDQEIDKVHRKLEMI